MLKTKNKWDAIPVDTSEFIDKMTIFPPNYPLDGKLRDEIKKKIERIGREYMYAQIANQGLAGIFADLHGDAAEEFVLLYPQGGEAYRRVGEEWKPAGNVFSDPSQGLDWQRLRRELSDGKVRAEVPDWKNLKIGSYEYRVVTE